MTTPPAADMTGPTSGDSTVLVRPACAADLAPYRRAVERSRPRLAPWNPVDPDDLVFHLGRQSAAHRTFLVVSRRPEGDHDIVARINVTNIRRGRTHSALLGYDAYDPYAGRGLFAAGLALLVEMAFAAPPAGLGLHRLEAAVQPGNVRSYGVLRRCGFDVVGAVPSFLWLGDAAGRHAWRDHLVLSVCADPPRRPYAAAPAPSPLVVLTGDGAPLGQLVADELHGSWWPEPLVRALGDGAGAHLARQRGAVVAQWPPDVGSPDARSGLPRHAVVVSAPFGPEQTSPRAVSDLAARARAATSGRWR